MVLMVNAKDSDDRTPADLLNRDGKWKTKACKIQNK